jgi:hypothetical protein
VFGNRAVAAWNLLNHWAFGGATLLLYAPQIETVCQCGYAAASPSVDLLGRGALFKDFGA